MAQQQARTVCVRHVKHPGYEDVDFSSYQGFVANDPYGTAITVKRAASSCSLGIGEETKMQVAHGELLALHLYEHSQPFYTDKVEEDLDVRCWRQPMFGHYRQIWLPSQPGFTVTPTDIAQTPSVPKEQRVLELAKCVKEAFELEMEGVQEGSGGMTRDEAQLLAVTHARIELVRRGCVTNEQFDSIASDLFG